MESKLAYSMTIFKYANLIRKNNEIKLKDNLYILQLGRESGE